MARYDKYDPISGGFRVRLADDWEADDGEPLGVGVDVDGRVVPGAGQSGVVGVMVLVGVNKTKGASVDVMTSGEILEMEGLTAGTEITADTTTGVLGDDAPDATHVRVGHTVEADRLVVRCAGVVAA